MITRVCGTAERISRHASTPLPSGKRTSSTTTSGCHFCAASSASATVPTASTRKKRLSVFNSAHSPSCTSCRSSTTRMRVRCSITLQPFLKNVRQEPCAPSCNDCGEQPIYGYCHRRSRHRAMVTCHVNSETYGLLTLLTTLWVTTLPWHCPRLLPRSRSPLFTPG